MNQERLYHVIFEPHVTEKSVLQGQQFNIHAFKVSVDSTKREIKKAIELLFDVKVDNVRTVSVKGKQKNFGRRAGKRKDWKKAYIRLAEGEKLDVSAE
jgi:large subunit ribosomal protein L23